MLKSRDTMDREERKSMDPGFCQERIEQIESQVPTVFLLDWTAATVHGSSIGQREGGSNRKEEVMSRERIKKYKEQEERIQAIALQIFEIYRDNHLTLLEAAEVQRHLEHIIRNQTRM